MTHGTNLTYEGLIADLHKQRSVWRTANSNWFLHLQTWPRCFHDFLEWRKLTRRNDKLISEVEGGKARGKRSADIVWIQLGFAQRKRAYLWKDLYAWQVETKRCRLCVNRVPALIANDRMDSFFGA